MERTEFQQMMAELKEQLAARINKQEMKTTSAATTPQPQIWETANAGKQIYDNVIKNERNFYPQDQNAFNYDWSVIKTIPTMLMII